MTNGLSTEVESRQVLADIRKYGCHVLHVAAAGGLAPFSYSVGINRSMHAPDLVIVGERRDLSHLAIRRYRDAVAAGRRFSHGSRVAGLMDRCEVELREVHPSHFRDRFDWNVALHGGIGFRMHQLVYPYTDGRLPWEPQASEWFRDWQPVLDVPNSAL